MRNDMEWFLVVTATRARILRSLPEPGEAALPELVMRAPSKGLRALMASRQEHHRPPRRQQPDGAGDDAYTLTEDERTFIAQVVALLESHRTAGDFNRLTIFATPHVLGLLRQESPVTLRARIGREFTRNLMRFPERKLPERIRQEISERPQDEN